jgi:hypothetical protein
MHFEGQDCSFSGVYVMIIGLIKDEVASLFCEGFFDYSACLIVHDVLLDFVSFRFKEPILLFVGYKDTVVSEVGKG